MPAKILRPLLILFFGFFIFFQHSNAASFINPGTALNKKDYLKASVFVKLSAKEFSDITGRKLNFFQKLYFKSVQRKLSREVKKNPDLLITQYYDLEKGNFKVDPVWFIVGAIIGPLAILFSFTSKQPKDKRTSAVLGCILFVLWFGFIFLF